MSESVCLSVSIGVLNLRQNSRPLKSDRFSKAYFGFQTSKTVTNLGEVFEAELKVLTPRRSAGTYSRYPRASIYFGPSTC